MKVQHMQYHQKTLTFKIKSLNYTLSATLPPKIDERSSTILVVEDAFFMFEDVDVFGTSGSCLF